MKSSTPCFALMGTALVALTFASTPLRAQEGMADCPMHAQHSQASAAGPELDARGDRVMGFDHQRTAHHFLLTPEGGAIEVAVADVSDGASRDAIRHHLGQVAEAFARGDFAMPAAIHARVLPGVETLRRLKEAITYRFEETEGGGRVRIATGNPEAREAIRAFLRAQIEDHRTGDPLEAPGGK